MAWTPTLLLWLTLASGDVSTPDPPGRAPADPGPAAVRPELQLSPEEAELALDFSPLPPLPLDPTNAVSGDPAAARLGQALFHDARLSRDARVSCATCHDPTRSFADGRRLAQGLSHVSRHTPALWNAAYQRWFYWDGRKDTLWSQALEPIEDPREHGFTRLEVLHLLRADADYTRAYTDVFGPLPDTSDDRRFPARARPVPGEPGHPHALAWAAMAEDDRQLVDTVYANVGKAIAAYERLLVSRRAPFDVFVEGLREDDPDKQAALSPEAQRGFALFAGKGRCHLCHDGPLFSDLEFHTNLVPTGEGADPGRALGVLRLQKDPFNSLSRHADDGGATGERKLSLAPRDWHLPGEFKTPGLRNVALTPPYMHEGQLDTLEAVVAFYSDLEGAARPDPRGERLMQAVHLAPDEQAELLAFLRALTDTDLDPALLGPPDTPYLEGSPR